MVKKALVIVLSMAMVLAFAACGKGAGSNKKIKIVTTTFPVYDWTRQIVGEDSENVEVTMLLDDGVDLHSYQPSAEDISKISKCDMFVCVGGESDEWTEDVLKEADNKDMVVVKLLDEMGKDAKEEECKEGMEAEKKEAHEEHGHDHKHEEKEESPEYDEHIWLSLKNAGKLCKSLEAALEKVDPDHADTYKENLKAYSKKLSDLDKEYEKVTSSAKTKTLLFGDRFPFRYLVDDYGLDYYAAFVGCSAESEASFKTISFLSGKADALGLKHIMTIENSDGKIAKAIIANTKAKNQDVLALDSMQSTTGKAVEKGATYLGVMSDNLKVLEKALNN